MPSLYNRITPQRVLIWLVIAGGIVAGPIVAYYICILGLPLVFLISGLLAAATWAFIARDRWWVPFPAALVLGGTFYYGFKIPIHEMALLICLFPLALALATRWQGPIAGRTHPPPSIFLLAAYLVLHWIGCLIYNKINGYGGIGNTTRVYMHAFWPMILFFSYYFFGNSKYARLAFFLMYLAAIFRVALGILMFLFPMILFIPGINFLPSVTGSGNADLRASCVSLAPLSACYFFLKKGWFLKLINASIFLSTFPLILYGGSRLSLVVILILPIYLGIIYRKLVLVCFLGLNLLVGILILNFYPDVIDGFPKIIQRTVSGFIFVKDVAEIQESTAISNEWHRRLQEAGRERWLSSLGSTIFGCGVRPYVAEDFQSGDFESMLKVANATGRYEAALWSILAIFGLVGLILYFNVIRFLLIDSFPQLWRQQICDTETAFAFLTSYAILVWLLLNPFTGGFPSNEIMLGLVAKTLHDDQIRKRKLDEEASEKIGSPSTPKLA